MLNRLLRRKGKPLRPMTWYDAPSLCKEVPALLPLIHKDSWRMEGKCKKNPYYSKDSRNKFHYILSIFTMIRVGSVKGVSQRWTNNANTNSLILLHQEILIGLTRNGLGWSVGMKDRMWSRNMLGHYFSPSFPNLSPRNFLSILFLT